MSIIDEDNDTILGIDSNILNSSKEELYTKISYRTNYNFNFNLIKKENINKKVVRTFSNFLNDAAKKGNQIVIGLLKPGNGNSFWRNFILNTDFQPPCTIKSILPCEQSMCFKSYNESYMKFLFDHNHSSLLYSMMLEEQKLLLEEAFNKVIHTKFSKVSLSIDQFSSLISKEKKIVKEYLEKLPEIYQTPIKLNKFDIPKPNKILFKSISNKNEKDNKLVIIKAYKNETKKSQIKEIFKVTSKNKNFNDLKLRDTDENSAFVTNYKSSKSTYEPSIYIQNIISYKNISQKQQPNYSISNDDSTKDTSFCHGQDMYSLYNSSYDAMIYKNMDTNKNDNLSFTHKELNEIPENNQIFNYDFDTESEILSNLKVASRKSTNYLEKLSFYNKLAYPLDLNVEPNIIHKEK